MPETPSYLLYTNQEIRAEKSLQWLRGPDADISSELATIHSNIRRMKELGTNCKNILVPQLLKPLLITCGLMFFQRYVNSIYWPRLKRSSQVAGRGSNPGSNKQLFFLLLGESLG